MGTAMPQVRRSARVALLAALALAGACGAGCGASRGLGRIERLDEASGVTFSSARAPLVFAHAETRYSVSGRDYLYLGPVETNRQGVREYLLWVAYGTTLDRGFLAPLSDAPETLYLRVQGEWMALELRPWTERAGGLAKAHPYHTAVALQAELAARITLNQLELMTQEQMQSIRVVDASGHAAEYQRWDDGPAWPGFVAADVP